jgi:hypothetical protein
MSNYYLITTFIVLLADAEAADKAQSNAWRLPDQGAATSRVDWLVGQRSGGLGRNMRVVDVRGVQSHLRVEPAEPTKQVIGAPLQGERSRPQDPEAGTIHPFSLSVSFSY